jgi:hypothetical protein
MRLLRRRQAAHSNVFRIVCNWIMYSYFGLPGE